MRDVHRRFAADKLVEPAVYLVLRHRVERRGRLVEYNHRGVLEERPCDREFLLFAAGKLHAVLLELPEHHGVPSMRQSVHLVKKTDLFKY